MTNGTVSVECPAPTLVGRGYSAHAQVSEDTTALPFAMCVASVSGRSRIGVAATEETGQVVRSAQDWMERAIASVIL